MRIDMTEPKLYTYSIQGRRAYQDNELSSLGVVMSQVVSMYFYHHYIIFIMAWGLDELEWPGPWYKTPEEAEHEAVARIDMY
jgi:hypothetical protein